jgi:hypothetical protein
MVRPGAPWWGRWDTCPLVCSAPIRPAMDHLRCMCPAGTAGPGGRDHRVQQRRSRMCRRHLPAPRPRDTRGQHQTYPDDPGKRCGPGRDHVAGIMHAQVEAREPDRRDDEAADDTGRPAPARWPGQDDQRGHEGHRAHSMPTGEPVPVRGRGRDPERGACIVKDELGQPAECQRAPVGERHEEGVALSPAGEQDEDGQRAEREHAPDAPEPCDDDHDGVARRGRVAMDGAQEGNIPREALVVPNILGQRAEDPEGSQHTAEEGQQRPAAVREKCHQASQAHSPILAPAPSRRAATQTAHRCMAPGTRLRAVGHVKRARERTLRCVRQALLVSPHEDDGGEGQDGHERGGGQPDRAHEPFHVVAQDIPADPEHAGPHDSPRGVKEQEATPRHAIDASQEGRPGA